MPDIPNIEVVSGPNPSGDLPVARPARPGWLGAGPPAPSAAQSVWSWLIRSVLVFSILLNIFFIAQWAASSAADTLQETFHSGNAAADDKVAIIRIHGPIMEGYSGFHQQQLKQAARDPRVKAVVLAINSPGGTVTMSEKLHKQIKDLKEGRWQGEANPKKVVVVSMESLAASGGYYIAAPADVIFAQPATITGSIGVYGMLPDISGLLKRYDVNLTLFKRGELKGMSMFKPLNVEEAHHLDAMLDQSYRQFLGVVTQGRSGRLKYGKSALDPREVLPPADMDPIARALLAFGDVMATPADLRAVSSLDWLYLHPEPFVRRLADGGVFNAPQARAYGLVDELGYVEDAVKKARELAGMKDGKAILYTRQRTIMETLLGVEVQNEPPKLRLDAVPGLTRGPWYLTPGYELTGVEIPLPAK